VPVPLRQYCQETTGKHIHRTNAYQKGPDHAWESSRKVNEQLNNIWKEIFAGIFADFTAALEQERGWEFLWQCEKGENTLPTAEGFQIFPASISTKYTCRNSLAMYLWITFGVNFSPFWANPKVI